MKAYLITNLKVFLGTMPIDSYEISRREVIELMGSLNIPYLQEFMTQLKNKILVLNKDGSVYKVFLASEVKEAEALLNRTTIWDEF